MMPEPDEANSLSQPRHPVVEYDPLREGRNDDRTVEPDYGISARRGASATASGSVANFKDTALAMAARGVPVIPLRPRSKTAFLKKWQDRATTDRAQIERWAKKYPHHNVGAVAKHDGIFVFDQDAEGVIERYEQETGETLPRTFTVASQPGFKPWKVHKYFRHVPGARLTANLNLAESKGFDLKAHNGYVVAPGSIHPDTGLPYQVVDNCGIALAPDGFVRWLLKQGENNETVQRHSKSKAGDTKSESCEFRGKAGRIPKSSRSAFRNEAGHHSGMKPGRDSDFKPVSLGHWSEL